MAVPISPAMLEQKKTRRSSATSRRRTGPCSRAAAIDANSGSARRNAPQHAQVYDRLGLPEFYALEAFVRWKE